MKLQQNVQKYQKSLTEVQAPEYFHAPEWKSMIKIFQKNTAL